MPKSNKISMSVIRRLPRYYRFISELADNGEQRISSGKLAELMNVTASQIRQDFNCFGGFGQQGYGYSISYLKSEMENILGLNKVNNAIILGAGNLGKAVALHINFAERGFNTLILSVQRLMILRLCLSHKLMNLSRTMIFQ